MHKNRPVFTQSSDRVMVLSCTLLYWRRVVTSSPSVPCHDHISIWCKITRLGTHSCQVQLCLVCSSMGSVSCLFTNGGLRAEFLLYCSKQVGLILPTGLCRGDPLFTCSDLTASSLMSPTFKDHLKLHRGITELGVGGGCVKSCQTVVIYFVQCVNFCDFFLMPWMDVQNVRLCLLNSDLSQIAVTVSSLLSCAIPNQGHVPPSLVNEIC